MKMILLRYIIRSFRFLVNNQFNKQMFKIIKTFLYESYLGLGLGLKIKSNKYLAT